MPRSLQRVLALVQKEMAQVLRDWRVVGLVLAIPVAELLLFAYATHMTVQHLPTVLADLSQDSQSRALAAALSQSDYFDFKHYVGSQAEAVRAIDEGRAVAGVVIPPGFAASVSRGSAQALVLLDGSDAFSARSGYAAAVAVGQARALALAQEKAAAMGIRLDTLPIQTSTRVLYNPEMNDLVFFLPALIAMVLQILATATTAQTVVREYELGTIEQLLATPARPVEMMIGKLVPNLLLMLVNLAVTVLLGVFWFGVPFQGNPWLFTAVALLFLWSGLGMGLLISAVSRSQQQALQITIVLAIFSMLLTGFVFPRTSMALVPRLVGNLLPLTYFIRIARGVITKGVGLSYIWTDVLALVVYAIVVLILAGLTAKRRLD